MEFAAYLHGAPGRLPFIGHFRKRMQDNKVRLAAAGCIAIRSDLTTAFRSARTIETAIASIQLSDYSDRHDLLNAAWEAIISLDACDLGPEAGADLCALFAVADQGGTGIAGVGLGGVWTWSDSDLQPLAVGSHPLLGAPGTPERLPGVLTLEHSVSRFVAVTHEAPLEDPTTRGLFRRCGVHP